MVAKPSLRFMYEVSAFALRGNRRDGIRRSYRLKRKSHTSICHSLERSFTSYFICVLRASNNTFPNTCIKWNGILANCFRIQMILFFLSASLSTFIIASRLLVFCFFVFLLARLLGFLSPCRLYFLSVRLFLSLHLFLITCILCFPVHLWSNTLSSRIHHRNHHEWKTYFLWKLHVLQMYF